MSNDSPDFHSYSTKELREVLGFIDRQKYPGRVEEILRILAEREHARAFEPSNSDDGSEQPQQPVKVTIAGSSVKRGRSYSLMQGISSIVFGILWLFALSAILDKQAEPSPLAFKLLFYFAGAATIIGGIVAVYNAFARNRFTLFDAVNTEEEPDPMARLLDPDKREE